MTREDLQRSARSNSAGITSVTAWHHFDFWLLGAVLLLVIFGVTMIRSAVAGNTELSELNLVNRQLIFAGAGFVVLLFTTALDYHLWASMSRTLYIGTVGFLAITVVIGSVAFGSARWFDTGVILIQPSEIAKIVVILTLANYFARNAERIGELRVVVESFLLTIGIVIWIVLQPNLSTSIVILVIWFAMLWAAGLKVKHLLLFIGVTLALVIIGGPILYQVGVIKEYQLLRITNFIAPDPNARHGDIYNIQQALISIGSGGWTGQGYGHGSQVQLRFLKVRWSDFIFSAMAQEFGFIGVVLVFLTLLFVVFRLLRAARMSRDTFGALICYGVATMIIFQAMVNVGVNLNLMPATGLTLPFVSYGGSSLLSILMGIGLAQSVILRHKLLEF
jgi:rod shape determining protein RodA